MLYLDMDRYTDESENLTGRTERVAAELPGPEADDATRMEAWRGEDLLQDDYDQ